MKTLWKIDTLKAFISWKYYLTYTSPEKNIYKTDSLYKYMIVRNPFINKASITKVFPYNEKNAFDVEKYLKRKDYIRAIYLPVKQNLLSVQIM